MKQMAKQMELPLFNIREFNGQMEEIMEEMKDNPRGRDNQMDHNIKVMDHGTGQIHKLTIGVHLEDIQ